MASTPTADPARDIHGSSHVQDLHGHADHGHDAHDHKPGFIERWSSFLSFGMIAVAISLFLIPAIPSWSGSPDAQRVVDLSVPVAIALLVVYAVVTVYSLRRHRIVHVASDDEATGVYTMPRPR